MGVDLFNLRPKSNFIDKIQRLSVFVVRIIKLMLVHETLNSRVR